MLDFEDLYNNKVEKCSHETAFNREEAKALFDLLYTLPDGANVLEIGVEFGRSTTVIGAVAKDRGFDFIAIDAWVGEYSPQALANIENVLVKEWGLPIELWSMPSYEARHKYNNSYRTYTKLDLIHIDGDHTYDGVSLDCELWAPLVKNGGYLVFDDYGHDSLPEVYAAVTHYMEQAKEWKFIGRFGNKLGVFKKL